MSPRRCKECKQTFATADSIRRHKRRTGECRSVEAMKAFGFTESSKGWRWNFETSSKG